MVSADVVKIALELHAEDRLDLARRLIESVVTPESLTAAISDGIQRIEDVATGRVRALSEPEYRDAVR